MVRRWWVFIAILVAAIIALAVYWPPCAANGRPMGFTSVAEAKIHTPPPPPPPSADEPPPPPPTKAELPPPPPGPEGRPHIIIVPVSKSMKRRMEHKFDHFSPVLALKRRGEGPEVPKRIEITERTEFYAFFVDPTGQYLNKSVVIQWYYRTLPEPFAKPISLPVMKLSGYKWPLATYAIWSAPPSARGLMSFMNYRSVRSRAEWDASRCWGPRWVKVSTFKKYKKDAKGHPVPVPGKLIAEAYFEIHQRGVTVY